MYREACPALFHHRESRSFFLRSFKSIGGVSLFALSTHLKSTVYTFTILAIDLYGVCLECAALRRRKASKGTDGVI